MIQVILNFNFLLNFRKWVRPLVAPTKRSKTRMKEIWVPLRRRDQPSNLLLSTLMLKPNL